MRELRKDLLKFLKDEELVTYDINQGGEVEVKYFTELGYDSLIDKLVDLYIIFKREDKLKELGILRKD